MTGIIESDDIAAVALEIEKALNFSDKAAMLVESVKKKYGGMELADAKRLKELEKENAELKKMLAESMLENRVLKAVNAKKW